MNNRFKDFEHVLRMAGLFALGIVAFFVFRALKVPDDFGVYGHYRAGALAPNRDYPLKFAGRAACIECHSDVQEKRAAGKHARIGCEACHGALGKHAADPDALKPVRPDPRSTCLICHAARPSKPAGFPQIHPPDHSPGGPCTECHVAHNPAVS
jgi:hypothetical protein